MSSKRRIYCEKKHILHLNRFKANRVDMIFRLIEVECRKHGVSPVDIFEANDTISFEQNKIKEEQ